jgi:CcmD family protein
MSGGLVYLGVAYLAAWAGISGYLVLLGRRQRAVERRLRDLRSQERSSL